MRKVRLEIETIKLKIAALKNKPIKMLINRGRKKINRVEGEIIEIYPSVFTVRVVDARGTNLLSYSFSDVLCGDVKIMPLEEGVLKDSAAE